MTILSDAASAELVQYDSSSRENVLNICLRRQWRSHISHLMSVALNAEVMKTLEFSWIMLLDAEEWVIIESLLIISIT